MDCRKKRNLMIIYFIIYIVNVVALKQGSENSEPMPLLEAIIASIPVSFIFLSIGYGIYYLLTIPQRNRNFKKENQQLIEKRRKEKIATAGKKPCTACGAPVSILAHRCEYCGTINANYDDTLDKQLSNKRLI